jgi:hypothetical protein
LAQFMAHAAGVVSEELAQGARAAGPPACRCRVEWPFVQSALLAMSRSGAR